MLCLERKERQIDQFFRQQNGLIGYDVPTEEDSATTQLTYKTQVTSGSFSFLVFCVVVQHALAEEMHIATSKYAANIDSHRYESMQAMESRYKNVNNKKIMCDHFIQKAKEYYKASYNIPFLHNMHNGGDNL